MIGNDDYDDDDDDKITHRNLINLRSYRVLSPEEKVRKRGRLIDWKNLYFPIGCGMVKNGVPANIMVVQRPDGTFGSATDPAVTYVTTVTPNPQRHGLGGGSGGSSSSEYHHTHQMGNNMHSTSFNYNKPGNHGHSNYDNSNHDNTNHREPNSNGEFQFSHQHVGPSGTTYVNFNYNGVGDTNQGQENHQTGGLIQCFSTPSFLYHWHYH